MVSTRAFPPPAARRRVLLRALGAAPLLASTAPRRTSAQGQMQADGVLGFWYLESAADDELSQELWQRLANGTWRAEFRLFEGCKETRRLAAQGSWELREGTLVHMVRLQAGRLVRPYPIAFDVLDVKQDEMRLAAGGGARLVARRVERSFSFPAPVCGAPGTRREG